MVSGVALITSITQGEPEMTQYMLAVWHKDYTVSPYTDEAMMQTAFTQVDAFNTALQASGSWVFGGGLQLPTSATVVTATAAGTSMTDGPFAESKEQIGGFWIIEASDADAALEWARQASAACMNPVEVRPFQG
jgi:hypothetical protein